MSISIELDETTAAVVQGIAAEENRSASEIIRDAVQSYANSGTTQSLEDIRNAGRWLNACAALVIVFDPGAKVFVRLIGHFLNVFELRIVRGQQLTDGHWFRQAHDGENVPLRHHDATQPNGVGEARGHCVTVENGRAGHVEHRELDSRSRTHEEDLPSATRSIRAR